jgi:hypothetical protein
MRGLQVPSGHFFSPATGTAMRSNNRAIDAPQLVVQLARIDDIRLQPAQDFVQCAVGVPGIEQTIHRFPRGKVVLRQISPGSASPQDPKNRIHDLPPIGRGPSGPRGSRKQVRDQFPLFIRQSMSRHYQALRAVGTIQRSQQFAQNVQFTEDQFSNRA